MKPKHLIVNLVSVADEPVSSQILVGVCELFGITANNARVTLARLVADKMLEAPRRGFYQLGEGATVLAEEVAGWREQESRVCEWQGDWLGVYIGALGRTDRTGLRRRMRVLKLAGFEELEQGLLIRPNNLKGGAEALRQRLYHLGLEKDARVMRLDDFSDTEQQQAVELWDTQSLLSLYQVEYEEMQQWIANVDQLSVEDAARESFLMGDRVLRNIAYDPMLPQQMIDVSLRSRWIAAMVEYDRVGNSCFETVYRQMSREVPAPS